MNAILFSDCYSGARLLDGALDDTVFTCPSGGTVSVGKTGALPRDTVSAKTTTIAFVGLPRVAAGANTGYFGPLRMSVSGKQWAWSGNAWALVNTTLPARTKVMQAWGNPPGAAVDAGGPFLEPIPGVQRNLVFFPATPFGGYLGGSFLGTNQTLQVDFFLPFGTGRFDVGRLFIGSVAHNFTGLSSAAALGMVDYSPVGTALSGTGSRRVRGVARKRTMTMESNFPNPTVSILTTDVQLLLLLDLIGVNSHVVMYRGASPTPLLGDGPECIYGVLRPPLEIQAMPGGRQHTRLELLETF